MNISFFLGALLLVDGVFAVDVTLSVMEGDSVTLKHHTEIPEDDSAEWWFGNKTIAIKETGGFSTSEGDKVGFKDRLNVDKQNGSLTITNITTKDTGNYKLQILGKEKTEPEIFSVTVTGKMTTVSVKEGESITLDTGLVEIKGYDLIMWKFKNQLIAEINKVTNNFLKYDTSDERFNGRLQLHPQIVSLIISNSRNTDSGDYHLNMISSTHTVQRNISVTVKGVFAVDVTVSVMEGDSVTLKHHTVIPEDASAEWWFGNKIIAIKETGGFSTSEGDDVGFKDRLNVDKHNGSLTITNITTKDTGNYKLQIRSRTETKDTIFSVTVRDASGVDADGVKSVKVMKGDTIPLFAAVNKIQENYQVQMFGDAGTLIDLNGHVDSMWSNYIRVDNKTGELNIINAQSNQSGDYTVEINTSSWSLHRKFRINITDNVMSVSGKEGHSVTLQTGVTNIQKDLIEWKFEGQVIPIPRLNDPVVKEWSNVNLNRQTGELTISNIRNNQSGDYEVNTSSMILHKKFHITVAIPQSMWMWIGIVGVFGIGIMIGIVIRNNFWSCRKKTLDPVPSEDMDLLESNLNKELDTRNTH